MSPKLGESVEYLPACAGDLPVRRLTNDLNPAVVPGPTKSLVVDRPVNAAPDPPVGTRLMSPDRSTLR